MGGCSSRKRRDSEPSAAAIVPVDDEARRLFRETLEDFQRRAGTERPFLGHARVFADAATDRVSQESIWAAGKRLQPAWVDELTYLYYTMKHANRALRLEARASGESCENRESFSVAEMTRLLGSGDGSGDIARADGSVQADLLLARIEEHARYSEADQGWVIPLAGLPAATSNKCLADPGDLWDVYADALYPNVAPQEGCGSRWCRSVPAKNAMLLSTYLGFYYFPVETARAAMARHETSDK